MDMKYVQFAFADTHFYDEGNARGNPARSMTGFQVSSAVDWTSWQRIVKGGWVNLAPAELSIPPQGWKIHSSATPKNAQHILAEVSRYCGERSISFKYLPSQEGLLRANFKYAGRAGSGKFITIYPADEDACRQIVEDLQELVGGEPGPYILSDIRWKDGPLYLRYGGFRMEQTRDEHDELVPAIRRPDGELEPDVRAPKFCPPSWVTLPDFVEEAKRNLAGSSNDPFPYTVSEALHFSNGGGVYLAEPTGGGEKVVLKEARPYAGLGPDGRSAVDRLMRERDVLNRLADVPAVVKVHDYFESFGHHFLVEEYVVGHTLNKEMVLRQPLVRSGSTRAERIAYRDWALETLQQVESAVGELHNRGLVFNDLHPNNVIVTKDGQVRLIDLEMAYDEGDQTAAPAGAPGFVAPDGRVGVAADRYALGCLKLAVFVPLTVLLSLDQEKVTDLVREATLQFELPEEVGQSILDLIGAEPGARETSIHVRRTRSLIERWQVDSKEDLDALRAGISRGIWESADLSRPDRVFPGDIRQFSENALGIAHGACGNLLADPGSAEDTERVLDWVEDALERMERPAGGFFDGVTGIAYTLRRFGRDAAADRVFEQLLTLPFERIPSDLYGGLAGIGLGLLQEYVRRDDPAVRTGVQKIQSILRDRTPELTRHVRFVDGQGTVSTGKGGLLFGATGQALFWLNSYEVFGDAADLDMTRAALDADLSACVDMPDGSLQLNEGWRTLPYLASGSVGIGQVILRALPYLDDPELRSVLGRIAHLTRANFTIQPNLFNGRAGLVAFLAAVADSPYAEDVTRPDLVRHTRALALHALAHRTGIHFPGEQLLRFSVDWGTGSAGVLTALDAYGEVVLGCTGSPSRRWRDVMPGVWTGLSEERPQVAAVC